MSFVKRVFRKILRTLSSNYRYGQLIYSQEGEEILLTRLMEDKDKGYYVDIGCHHPMRFSNTYSFYLMGWHGINIDANVDTINKFNKCRKRDINILSGVGTPSTLKFYRFNESAVNTFVEERAKALIEKSPYNLIDVQEVKVRCLSELLDEYLPQGQNIDFMDIDVEGMDLEVLKTNNWEKYRPQYLLVEANMDMSLKDIEKMELIIFLESVGYELYARLNNTLLCRDLRTLN